MLGQLESSGGQRGERQETELLRRVLCWCFALTSFLYLIWLLRVIWYATQFHYSQATHRELAYAGEFFAIVSGICGVAWWTVWKRGPAARSWAIAASLVHGVIFLRQFVIVPSQAVWGHHVGALIVGVVGLIFFLRRGTEQ